MLIVTTDAIAGYQIDAVLGEVRGVTVRTPKMGQYFSAGIGGGEASGFTKMAYETRGEAVDRMWADAQERGANAVVGMRFDTSTVTESYTEVCAYGTAVVVRPLAES